MPTTRPTPAMPSRARIGWAALALGAGAIGFAVSLSIVTTRSAPARALAAWPWNANATAEQATRAIGAAQDPATIAKVDALARRALRGQPVAVPAARALAVTAALREDGAKADRAIGYAESLSRRDLPTEMWLIEDRVGRNDIPGALRHYDRALRASDSAPDLLFPILFAASADRAVAQPLARLLAARPLWWKPFVVGLIQRNPSDLTTFAIARAVRLDADDEEERAMLVSAMRRLADAGRVDLARALAPASMAGQSIRDGGFERDPRLPPFDWAFQDEGDLGAYIQPREGGGNALFLIARNGHGGEVARQLLTLKPGTYRLRGVAGDIAAASDAPIVALTCAAKGTALATVKLARASANGARFERAVTIPAGCPGQWLAIRVSSPIDVSDRQPWVDDLTIARR